MLQDGQPLNQIAVSPSITLAGSKIFWRCLETVGKEPLFGHSLAQSYHTMVLIGTPLRPGD